MRTLIFTVRSSGDVQHRTNARHGRTRTPRGNWSCDEVGRREPRILMSPHRASYWTRRLARNVGIVGVALVIHLVVVTRTSGSGDVMYRLSMATGYVSVALIAWALLIGPWRVRRGRPAPASTDLRRDVGIWGGIFGLAHVVTGLQVHFAGAFWKYFLYPDGDHWVPLRHDLFGFSNWTGLAAALVLLLLLAIS